MLSRYVTKACHAVAAMHKGPLFIHSPASIMCREFGLHPEGGIQTPFTGGGTPPWQCWGQWSQDTLSSGIQPSWSIDIMPLHCGFPPPCGPRCPSARMTEHRQTARRAARAIFGGGQVPQTLRGKACKSVRAHANVHAAVFLRPFVPAWKGLDASCSSRILRCTQPVVRTETPFLNTYKSQIGGLAGLATCRTVEGLSDGP